MSIGSGQLVFTDLDGSLLDHYSYRFDAAESALQQLQKRGTPVIPATSKTRSEIQVIREALRSDHPFIVENGAAIFIPVGYFPGPPPGAREREGYWVREFSAPREHWLGLLAELGQEFAGEFEAFHRVGAAGIARMTGLDEEGAALANLREYSEPVRWTGPDARKAEFIAALESAGARLLQGGRFLTIAGECDKGTALRWLREIYSDALGRIPIHDLAIGDSGNDIAMLEAAETALVIRSPVHDFPHLQRSTGVIYSSAFGPAGWAEGVGQWLQTVAEHTGRG